jgi:hypothetical protein
MAHPSYFGPKNKLAASFIVAAIAAAGAASQARADDVVILPDAVWSGENNMSADGDLYPQQPLTSPGTYTNSVSTPQGASGTSVVTTSGLSFPSISVSVQTSSTGNQSIVAVPQAELDYYFYVTGPDIRAHVEFSANGRLTDPAPLDASTGVVLSIDGASWLAQIQVADDGVFYNSEPASPGFNASAFTLQGGIFATVGQVYEVKMSAGISVEAAEQGPINASAYIDPYLFIDPATPNADEYSIVTSSGIGNALPGAVPEASTWAMILAGFVGLGYAGFSRKAASAVAA